MANTPTPGDVNGDGIVNTADLTIVLKNDGLRNARHSDGDITGAGGYPDGLVNEDDFIIALTKYSP